MCTVNPLFYSYKDPHWDRATTIATCLIYYKNMLIFQVQLNTLSVRRYVRDEVLNTARLFILNQKSKPVDRRDTTRDDLFITLRPEEAPDFEKGEKILEELINRGPFPRFGSKPNRDSEIMKAYLTANCEKDIPILPETELRNMMVGETPLLTHILSYIDNHQTEWLFPPNLLLEDCEIQASLDWTTPSSVPQMEVTINKTSPVNWAGFNQWIFSHHRYDQDRFPSGLTSVDLEEIKIHKDDYRSFRDAVSSWQEGDPPLLIPKPPARTFKKSGSKAPEYTNLPAKIIFGNGISWFASIRFPYDLHQENGKTYYKLDPEPITLDNPCISLLQRLKTWTGQGIMADRNFLQDFLFRVYKINVALPEVVEIDALSHAAGYRLNRSNMFTTHIVTTGTLLNKVVSCADGLWALPMDKLPTEFKIYLYGDVKFGFINSLVYMTLLLHNMFPDPHIMCQTLELTQRDAVAWFSHLVTTCISEMRIDSHNKKDATTREDLIKAMALFDEYGSIVRSPSAKANLFAKLIPDWPSPIHGGPRFLHHVRAFFVSQYRILQELGNHYPEFQNQSNANLFHEIDEHFIETCTFGRGVYRESIISKSLGSGFKPYPDHNYLQLSSNKLKNSNIACQAEISQCPRGYGILENLRLNAELRSKLFHCLGQLDLTDPEYSFWLQRTTLYNDIKNMISILLDIPVMGVPQLEQEINRKFHNVFDQEERTRRKDEIVVEKRKKREQLFAIQKRNCTSGITKRTGVQQRVYAIVPGDYTERNRKAKERMKKNQALLKMLPDYIPRHEWIAKVKAGLNPSRASFRNFKQMEHDLRDVLIQENARKAAKQKLTQASSSTNTDQPGPSKPVSCHMLFTRTVVNTNVKAQSQKHDGNDSDVEPNTQDLDDSFDKQYADPAQARYADPGRLNLSNRTPQEEQKKKKKGKGKGKGKNSHIVFNPHQHTGFSTPSDSDDDHPDDNLFRPCYRGHIDF